MCMDLQCTVLLRSRVACRKVKSEKRAMVRWVFRVKTVKSAGTAGKRVWFRCSVLKFTKFWERARAPAVLPSCSVCMHIVATSLKAPRRLGCSGGARGGGAVGPLIRAAARRSGTTRTIHAQRSYRSRMILCMLAFSRTKSYKNSYYFV